ncbi:MAG: acyl-CoA dehydrogenase family protein [Deltaproteobacteria bacterium]|nr:acyl-CoA dehydrogenase family protein [Deltaproteobacteria bacterium]
MSDVAANPDLLNEIRAFVDEQVLPLESDFLLHGFAAVRERLEDVRAVARQRGFFAPQLPPSLGGLGLGLAAVGEVSRVLGRTPLGHFVLHMQAPDVSNMELPKRWGTPAQQERWLLPLTRGELRSCFSMTEPEHAGSNPTELSTTATRDGDSWVIRGRKWFTSSADGAAFAIVMAVSNPDAARPHERASFFLVPTDTPGFRLVQNLPVMGHGGPLGEAGWASHAEVRYDDVRVPLDALVGQEGAGFAMAQERLGPGRIHHAMRWIGIAERCLELMVARAATRRLGPGVMLGHKDTVQGWIGRSWAELEAARLLVRDTARDLEVAGQKGARLRISAVKLLVADVLDRIMDKALQVHGALGMTDFTPIAFWYRHERAARIYDGPDEVHEQVIARELLGAAGMPKPAKSGA